MVPNALDLPNLDKDARLALQYHLGLVYEPAGDAEGALEYLLRATARSRHGRESTSASAEAHRDCLAPASIRCRSRNRFHDYIMKRVLSVLFFLLYFETGVLLLLIPWAAIWTKNYFVHHSLLMAAVAKNYFVRGAVSGIGLADMWLAAYELWHLWRRAPG